MVDDALPSEVEAVLNRFFDESGTGLSLLGRGPLPLGLERSADDDPTEPLFSRLRTLERHLLDHVALFASPHDEIDTYREDYAKQPCGEVVATLIALREQRCGAAHAAD